MSEASFFVRMRGKVSGPFTTEALQRMVRTSILSRVHEVSSDRKTWERASEYEELFPSTDASAPRTQPPAEQHDGAPIDCKSMQHDEEGKQHPAAYFLIIASKQVGPFTLRELENQPVIAKTPVWRQGQSNWIYADQMPELASMITSDDAAQASPRATTSAPLATAAPPPFTIYNADSNISGVQKPNQPNSPSRPVGGGFVSFGQIDFKTEVWPFNVESVKRLMSQPAFWAISLIGSLPLFIGTLNQTDLQLTAFAIFFRSHLGDDLSV